MSTSTVLLTPTADLNAMSFNDFRADVVARVQAGSRLLSMFAIPVDNVPSKTHRLHAIFIQNQRLVQACAHVHQNDSLRFTDGSIPSVPLLRARDS